MAIHTLTLNALKLASASLIAVAALPLSACALDSPETAADPAMDMQDHTPQTDWQSAPVLSPAGDAVLVPGRADYFAAADFDDTGSLTPDEYTLFVDTLAGQGDAEMLGIQTRQSYAQAFTVRDENTDGVLTYDELTPEVIPDPAVESMDDAEVPEADILPDMADEIIPVPEVE